MRLPALVLCGILLLFGCNTDESAIPTEPSEQLMPNYFPDAVGSRWVYQNADGTRWTREVTDERDSQGETYRTFAYTPPLTETEFDYLKPAVYRVTQNQVFFVAGERVDRYVQNEVSKAAQDEFAGLELNVAVAAISHPELIFFQFPLSVNAQWDALNVKVGGNISLQNLGILQIPFEVDMRVKGAVVSEGSLETPAGAFEKTYQIEYQTEITQTLFSEAETSRYSRTVWFAPHVGIVKIEDERGVTELIEYTFLRAVGNRTYLGSGPPQGRHRLQKQETHDFSRGSITVVILSDNKPGHYKQSLGIVEQLPECRTEWLELQFRRKWRDNLLRVFICIFGGTPLPMPLIHALLRWSLTSDVYNALAQLQVADVILSTGSSVAAVNLLLGRILGAKTVTCRRPSPIGTRHFDLAILPMLSWGGKRNRDNVCKTVGVPNPISPDTLNVEQKRLRQERNLPDCPRIGVLLGGTDRHETITTVDAEQLLKICEILVAEIDAQILVTTSRRTPPDVTAHLASTLTHADWCPLFITPDTSSALADPYQAILALSDLLVVTADSFSMVCEAASSGRKVILLTLSREKARLPKRYGVYRYLEEHGIVRQCGLDRLKQHITAALTSRMSTPPLKDTETAGRAIRCLITSS